MLAFDVLLSINFRIGRNLLEKIRSSLCEHQQGLLGHFYVSAIFLALPQSLRITEYNGYLRLHDWKCRLASKIGLFILAKKLIDVVWPSGIVGKDIDILAIFSKIK